MPYSRQFEPMLAATLDDVNRVCFPVVASPKLDGIRCCIIDGVAMSRNLKPIPNRHVQHLFGRHRFDGLDGELIIGKPYGEGVFNRSTSGVMSQHGEPLVKYYVFDCFVKPDMAHSKRLSMAVRMAGGIEDIEIVRQTELHSVDDLLHYEAVCLKKGYEGIMLRKDVVSYKYGRSTMREHGLIKLKRFAHGEALVIGVEELQTNTNPKVTNELGRSKRSSHKAGKVAAGTLGAFIVKDLKTNVTFNIGVGTEGNLTFAKRAELWKIKNLLPGRIVRFQYQKIGTEVAPRLPLFDGFRDVRDL